MEGWHAGKAFGGEGGARRWLLAVELGVVHVSDRPAAAAVQDPVPGASDEAAVMLQRASDQSGRSDLNPRSLPPGHLPGVAERGWRGLTEHLNCANSGSASPDVAWDLCTLALGMALREPGGTAVVRTPCGLRARLPSRQVDLETAVDLTGNGLQVIWVRADHEVAAADAPFTTHTSTMSVVALRAASEPTERAWPSFGGLHDASG